jgi:hypothetical protein
VVIFESDFQNKIIYQTFEDGASITKKSDVLVWKAKWTQELASWHSPYKTLIDFSNCRVDLNPEVIEQISLLWRFFEGLFMKKASCFGLDRMSDNIGISCFATEEEAVEAIGIRTRKKKDGEELGFRQSLTITNDFAGHVLEVTLENAQIIDTQDKLEEFRQKIMNNLMQWHSAWTLFIDIQHLEVKAELFEDFKKMLKLFENFFMKSVVGYGVSKNQKEYPFKVYRSRHKAAAMIEREGNFSADKAHCRSGGSPDESESKPKKKDPFKIHRG